MAQRLLCNVCPFCAKETEPEKHVRLLGALLEVVKTSRGRGRRGMYRDRFQWQNRHISIKVVHDDIRNIICQNAPGAILRALAGKKRFGVMLEGAMDKEAREITSVERLFEGSCIASF